MSGLSRRAILGMSGAIVVGTGVSWLSPTTSAVAAARPRPADEDGYDLWLRYRLVDQPGRLQEYRAALTEIIGRTDTPILAAAVDELERGLAGLLGRQVPVRDQPTGPGALIVGTSKSSSVIRALIPERELAMLGSEGYVLRRTMYAGRPCIVVAGADGPGVLYGAFHLLRLLQVQQRLDRLDIRERPVNELRLVNHWDNMNRTVERGYAGKSIFHWDALPDLDPRYTDYARILASVGINGTVVNNVNSSPQFLASEFLPGLAALADLLRRYGIRLYLSANFGSPIVLSGLDTADPLAPEVRRWWRDKADELYRLIPDFGGFLVKADSEGQPGPQNYGRTHADGANMIAEALAPHGGIVMWRAFVYGNLDSDRAKESFKAFHSLDGDFADNVIVQIKNGPIDFQVREPTHPLFGGLPHTNSMIELEITQEYTGRATDVCYLPSEWKKVLDFDTHAAGNGTFVRDIVAGSVHGYTHSGFAGVINFGDDRNWTGSHLAAANTHGYARLAWNPTLPAEQLAGEWVRMTFGNDTKVVQILTSMLLGAWLTYEDYTSPLGVGFMCDSAHWDPAPAQRTAYHHSDSKGTGYDRTMATGSGYTGQYAQPVAQMYESLDSCPEHLLLFFHHVPYTHRLGDIAPGATVIQYIYDTHFAGVEKVEQFQRDWSSLGRLIDAERHSAVADQLAASRDHAVLWRDSIVTYFYNLSGIPDERGRLPATETPPASK